MANPASVPPAGEPSAHMKGVYGLPDEGVGDDQKATSIRQHPLYRPGSPSRIQFDLKNQMTIEVRFKIYTPTAVDVNLPSQSADRVVAAKKQPKSVKLNLINSKKMKGKYLQITSCLIGKSLNEFKTIVADACEEFSPGMKTIVLNRNFMPELKWKTTVGRSKQVLESAVQWQAFVGALEKSIKKQGVVSIENENVEAQSIEDSTASATRQLIEQTNGGGSKTLESKESNKDAELRIMANEIFSQAGLCGYAGGDGTVLSVPWDPQFHYRLTFAAAWIWAKGVMANIASQHIPPNTREFIAEIKKSEWRHPDMGVDDRVRMRLQGHPRHLKAVKGASNGASSLSRKSTRVTKSKVIESKPDLKKRTSKQLIDLTNSIDKKPNLKKLTSKRFIDLTNPIDAKPDLKKLTEKRRITDFFKLTESKPDPKKIKIEESKTDLMKIKNENQPGHSIDAPMCLSSDTESHIGDSENEGSNVNESSDTNEVIVEDSEIDPTNFEESDDNKSDGLEIPNSSHSVEMELFMADCDIPYQDEKTRSILKDAGFLSWTDLIPSVQLTESTLTAQGIDRQIASRLMEEAKARYYTN